MKHSVPVISMVEKKEETMLFEIQSMEYIDENRQNRIEQPHKHDYFVIIWVQKGKGNHVVDFVNYPIDDQTIYFLTPGQIHHLEAEGQPRGMVISFHNDFFSITGTDRELLLNSGLFYDFTTCSPNKLDASQAALFAELTGLMQKEITQQGYMHYENLRSLLKLLLIHASRFWGHPGQALTLSGKSAAIARNFLQLVEQHFMEKTKVSDYASMLVLTPSHLNDTVKQVTGFPASDHIKNRMILEAKRRAFFKDASAKEIAYELGFDDEAHFSRYFKNNAGITFSAFKKTVAAAL